MTKEAYIVNGLEIGSSKVIAVVAEILEDGTINVLGVGSCPSKGIENGNITDVEAASKAVGIALKKAENDADKDIETVLLSLTGLNLYTNNQQHYEELPGGVVTQESLKRINEKAYYNCATNGREVLKILPQEYRVDNQPYTKNPLHQSGMRLSADVYTITGESSWLKNFDKIAENNRIYIADKIYAGFASDHAVLTDEEKEAGVCLVDFGGGTIDFTFYTDGVLRYTFSYPFGAKKATEMISQYFGISFNEAENIKTLHGSAISPPSLNPEKRIEARSIGGYEFKEFTKEQLSQVTAHFYHDLLSNVIAKYIESWQYDLKRRNLPYELGAGVVFTGGASRIEGMQPAASRALSHLTGLVRIGRPQRITGLADYVNLPQHATVIGLLQYYYRNERQAQEENVPQDHFVVKIFKKVFGHLGNNL